MGLTAMALQSHRPLLFKVRTYVQLVALNSLGADSKHQHYQNNAVLVSMGFLFVVVTGLTVVIVGKSQF